MSSEAPRSKKSQPYAIYTQTARSRPMELASSLPDHFYADADYLTRNDFIHSACQRRAVSMSFGSPFLDDERTVIVHRDAQREDLSRRMHGDTLRLQNSCSSEESFEELCMPPDSEAMSTSQNLDHSRASNSEREEFLTSEVSDYLLVGMDDREEESTTTTTTNINNNRHISNHLLSSEHDFITSDTTEYTDGHHTTSRALSTDSNGSREETNVSKSFSSSSIRSIQSQPSLNQSMGMLQSAIKISMHAAA